MGLLTPPPQTGSPGSSSLPPLGVKKRQVILGAGNPDTQSPQLSSDVSDFPLPYFLQFMGHSWRPHSQFKYIEFRYREHILAKMALLYELLGRSCSRGTRLVAFITDLLQF